MAVTDGRDSGDDYVSMHHRIRRSLRKRLKHLSTDIEKPVTDIVNEAIMSYLDRTATGQASISNLAPAEILDALRQARANGTFYEAVSKLDKLKLVEVSRLLGEAADMRSSGDRLVSRIVVALSEPVAR